MHTLCQLFVGSPYAAVAGPAKPAIAQRLEAESAALAAKRAELTPEKIAEEHRAAEERRAKVLEEKVAKAKEMEGGRSRESSPKREAK